MATDRIEIKRELLEETGYESSDWSLWKESDGGGKIEWTDGMLYPVLHRLERQGHIEGNWGTAESGRKRKYYRITGQGRTQLAEQKQQWQAVDSALRNIWLALSATRAAALPHG